MRTITAIFGFGLIVTALLIGWWSPVAVDQPSRVAQAGPERPEVVAAVEPAREAAPASGTEAAEPDPIQEDAAQETDERDLDVFYTSANVRMRSGPSSNFAIVWTAPAGTQVRSLQVDGNWHFVTTADHEGWIYNRYLSESSQ